MRKHKDFKDVLGQEHVKRGLEVAAAGGHNVLLIGPPKSGKRMMAERFTTILPNMTPDEVAPIGIPIMFWSIHAERCIGVIGPISQGAEDSVIFILM